MHSSKEIVAYHEAGHAVMFFLCNFKVESIRIDQYGNVYTKCPTHFPSAFITPLNTSKEKIGTEVYRETLDLLAVKYRKYALINFAGYCAEFKFLKKNMPYGLRAIGNPKNDISKIESEVKKANALYGETIFSDLNLYFWCKETKYIIRKPKVWETIVELADALVNSTSGIIRLKAINAILIKRLEPYPETKLFKKGEAPLLLRHKHYP